MSGRLCPGLTGDGGNGQREEGAPFISAAWIVLQKRVALGIKQARVGPPVISCVASDK